MIAVSDPYTSTASAVVAAIVAVLVVMAFPGLSIGDPTTSHGGSPSNVFMSTDPGVCNGEDPVGTEPVSLMPTQVDVGEDSHLLVYFTATWSGFRNETALVLTSQILDGNGFFESSPDWIARGGSGHGSGTVMWTFEDISSGHYTVQATAQLAASAGALHGGEGANLQSCALTAFVIPVAK